jgi:hypothetical protein
MFVVGSVVVVIILVFVQIALRHPHQIASSRLNRSTKQVYSKILNRSTKQVYSKILNRRTKQVYSKIGQIRMLHCILKCIIGPFEFTQSQFDLVCTTPLGLSLFCSPVACGPQLEFAHAEHCRFRIDAIKLMNDSLSTIFEGRWLSTMNSMIRLLKRICSKFVNLWEIPDSFIARLNVSLSTILKERWLSTMNSMIRLLKRICSSFVNLREIPYSSIASSNPPLVATVPGIVLAGPKLDRRLVGAGFKASSS